jgi:hypothetical protein
MVILRSHYAAAGMAGGAGSCQCLPAAAMTVPRFYRAEAPRRRRVSLTLAGRVKAEGARSLFATSAVADVARKGPAAQAVFPVSGGHVRIADANAGIAVLPGDLEYLRGGWGDEEQHRRGADQRPQQRAGFRARRSIDMPLRHLHGVDHQDVLQREAGTAGFALACRWRRFFRLRRTFCSCGSSVGSASLGWCVFLHGRVARLRLTSERSYARTQSSLSADTAALASPRQRLAHLLTPDVPPLVLSAFHVLTTTVLGSLQRRRSRPTIAVCRGIRTLIRQVWCRNFLHLSRRAMASFLPPR